MAVARPPMGWRLLSKLKRRQSLFKRLAREESGFQLIELMVVAAMLPIVLSAILFTLDSVSAQAPKNVEYGHAVTEAQASLQRLMTEVAQATKVNLSSANLIDFNVVLGGNSEEIQYDCGHPDPGYPSSYTRCLRLSVAAGGTIPTLVNSACPATLSGTQTCTVAIDRVVNNLATDPVFTYTNPNNVAGDPPSWVEAKVEVPASGTLHSGLNHTITLDNATAIRNLSYTIL